MFFPFISTMRITANIYELNFGILWILSDHKNSLFIPTSLTLNLLSWHSWILTEILVYIDWLKWLGVEAIDCILSSTLSINNHLKLTILSWTSISQVSIDHTWLKSIMTLLTELYSWFNIGIITLIWLIFVHY